MEPSAIHPQIDHHRAQNCNYELLLWRAAPETAPPTSWTEFTS
jgi:hypothetical protein